MKSALRGRSRAARPSPRVDRTRPAATSALDGWPSPGRPRGRPVTKSGVQPDSSAAPFSAGQRPCSLAKQTLGVESGANSGCGYRRFYLLPTRHIRAFRVSNVVRCRSVADISDSGALGNIRTRCPLAGLLRLNLSADGASSGSSAVQSGSTSTGGSGAALAYTAHSAVQTLRRGRRLPASNAVSGFSRTRSRT